MDTYLGLVLGVDNSVLAEESISDCLVVSAGWNDNMPEDNPDLDDEFNPPFNATTYFNYGEDWDFEAYFSDVTADWVPNTTKEGFLTLLINRSREG